MFLYGKTISTYFEASGGERARELKAKGLNNTDIAQALNVTPRTVANYLKS